MPLCITLLATAFGAVSWAQAGNPTCIFGYNYIIEFGPDAQTQPYNLLVDPAGCTVSVSNIPSWATVQGPPSGVATGKGALLTVGVSANTTSLPRSGVTLPGDAFPAVVQNSSSCTVSVAPAVVNVPNSGGSGTIMVTDSPTGCWVNVASVPSWIIGPYLGQEIVQSPFTLSYTVPPNPGGSRSGTVSFVSDPSTTASITFNQAAVGPGLTITTTALPVANNGLLYAATMGAGGGTPPYTWMATGLPDDIILNANGAFTGYADPSASGIYDITVTVTDSDGTTVSQQLPLLVTTSATMSAAPQQLQFSAVQGGGTTAAQTVTVTASGTTPTSFTIQTDTGTAGYYSAPSWLNVTPLSGSTPAVLMVTASPGTLPPGTLTARIRVVPNQTQTPTAITVTFTITAATVPSISPGGLVIASSFGGMPTVGPGTYIEIYGQNLAPATADWGKLFVNNVAPTSVQGVGVKINGEAAFVDYVSPGQINALVPGDLSAGPAQVVVSNAQGSSAPFTVNVAAQQPTLLAPDSFVISGKQYVAAFLPDNVNALPAGAIAGVTSRPAKPGETLVFYGLGFGAVSPNVPVGTIAPAQQTNLNTPLHFLFNQTPGKIVYSGLASGFVGLYQFNVQVPQVADNDAVPLTFTLGGTAGTQTLYIAVHQ